MSKMKILCALLLIVTVSACSSGGGGGGSKSDSDSDTASDGGGGSSGGGGGSSGGGGGSSGGGGGGGGSSSDPVSTVTFALPTILSVAPGTTGAPIPAGTAGEVLLSGVEAEFDAVEMAIKDGSIDNTPTFPAGAATLNGYVRIGGKNANEIIFGNLEIAIADFSVGTPTGTVVATGLREFNSDGSTLTGTNLINPNLGELASQLAGTTQITGGTTIEGTLNGQLYSSVGADGVPDPDSYHVSVTSTFEGDFYDDVDGTLLTYGTVEGTSKSVLAGATLATNDFDNGEFAAGE